ncbi:MAG TPA: AAA family ATPase [Solirubrobacteraceae bacterium]|nr:AAA family ATPase [Solirubrobacteraceae bacterium]
MEMGSAAAEAGASLRGRAEECARLDALVGDVRRGESRSLVLRGEAGIGKTALLHYVIASASDLTVLRAVGVESEMELAYASLHQLCGAILDRLARLPDPQREALEIVFGLRAGPPPDRFLVGLGVLSLLADVAEERPLLCVVDDAQWLDDASALTLAFVARRLLAERVGLVFAAREPGGVLEHVPALELRGLRNGDARALLRSAVRFRLDDQVLVRIVSETRGNPLALLELPRGLTPTELAGGFGLLDARGLLGSIEESFVRRIAPLPEDTRLLLLVAAAEPVGDPLLVWRAAERLGIVPEASIAAEAAGLLSVGDRVIFRHPLVRSAAYGSAAAQDRRAVHLALAQATDREVDPDRRAWHLAAAAMGPHEEVAAELERSAGRAQARGGMAAAAAFLKRSVALTLDPTRRAERALAAAQAHLQAGAFDEALRLLASAEVESLDELGRARVELLRGQIAFASTGGGGEAPALMLLEAARRLEPLDPALARETYLEAWNAAYYAGGFARAGTLLEISKAARSAPWPRPPSRPADLVLDGLSLLVSEGPLAAAPKLRKATSAFADGEIPVSEGLRWGWAARLAAVALWDEARWYQILVRQLQSVREAGLLAYLPIYLNSLAMAESSRGDFATAGSLIAEADMIREATGTRIGRLAAVNLEGIRGREAEAFGLLEAEAKSAAAAGQGQVTQWCKWAAAFLYNGLGRYEQALTAAQRASEEAPELLASRWALAELIEAAARTGQTGLTVGALERLAESTTAGGADWGMGVLAYSRALLTEGEAAEGFYREAIGHLRRTALRPWLARAHLLYGEWLRREGRRVDARAQLRAAHEQFTSMGMEAYAERTRRELVATGEHVRRRVVEARDDLTAQERQVALLARDGMSNPEIGARLFLSQHTVAYHLRKVFSKLEISSRYELVAALPSSESELLPA